MRWRVHPLLLNALGARPFGHIFGQRTKARAGLRGAVGHSRLAGQPVRKCVPRRHTLCMPSRRRGQCDAPLQRREALRHARAIRGFKQRFRGARLPPMRPSREKKQDRCADPNRDGSKPLRHLSVLFKPHRIYFTRRSARHSLITGHPEPTRNVPGILWRWHLAGGVRCPTHQKKPPTSRRRYRISRILRVGLHSPRC